MNSWGPDLIHVLDPGESLHERQGVRGKHRCKCVACCNSHNGQVGIKIFERGTVEQKAAIFFYMADDDQGGYLSRSELLDALEEQGTVGQGSIDLVEQLFKVAIKAKEVVGEGKKMAISLQGFLRAVKECPEIGSYLGLHKYKSLASWER